jgi:hypothetical protein
MEEVVEVGLTSPATPVPEGAPVLKAQVVEEILGRLARGEAVARLAEEYGVDRKTIRAWRARGGYRPREPRVRESGREQKPGESRHRSEAFEALVGEKMEAKAAPAAPWRRHGRHVLRRHGEPGSPRQER